MIKILLFTALAVACVSCDSGSKSVGSTETSALPYAFWGWSGSQECCPRILLICKRDGHVVSQLERDFEWSLNVGSAVYNRRFVKLPDAKLYAENLVDSSKLCDK